MWDRPVKNEVRERIFNEFPKATSCFLDLPAVDMLSVLEAKKQQVINSDTRCVFVERKRCDAEKIENKAKKLKLNCSVFGGELHNLRDLRAKTAGQKLSVANFDTCSTPNFEILSWISNEICQGDLWETNGVFSFTFQEVPRGSQSWYDAYSRSVGENLSFTEIAHRLICSSLWKYNVELLFSDKYHDTTDKGRLPTMLVSIYRNTGSVSSKKAKTGFEDFYRSIYNYR